MSSLSFLRGRARFLFGDVEGRLDDIEEPVQCVVTSPPYWQLRDYDHPKQVGLEADLGDFIARLVRIFAAVREFMSDDGVLWLNMGDTYIAGRSGGVGSSTLNAMPESVRDRPSRDHEHVFLLSKSARYYYDADAIRTPLKPKTLTAHGSPARVAKEGDHDSKSARWASSSAARRVAKRDAAGELVGANARTVWPIPQEPWPGAHTSTFPTKLARRCILAGCPVGGLVLDPFAGTGTTVRVAAETGRRGVGIELNPANETQIRRRMAGLQMPLIPEVAHG